ncbi:3-oxoacyl-ACP reductase [Spongiactinospora gelatinilytica]|uniref:3-oxoacyl-ACP reductase n=1 Tax=Spongiactinospora gelatinilytica TaxID=2666298 RepID=A0A2W2EZT8_9ACTN|nr:SDR family NAD(P)-dependent oxidoreductase [Spongiactinospora gelatinilytica]PZG28223.1 3-oxoacyl-ACP reductase [Spongiactinospora gelatinilytica]
MRDTGLTGRVALLTGASGGIGTALGRRLIAAGVTTAFAYATHADAAGTLVNEAKEAGLNAIAVPADLADPAAPAALIDTVVRALGPIDVLIPNAGLGEPCHYAEVDLAMWDRSFAVNLRAPFLLAQAVLPGMVERGFGRVLFTSSLAAFTGGIVGPHYAAAKAGLHALAHHLASRVAAAGVTVNVLAPALIEDTRMLPPSADRSLLPVGRFGRPEEVADLAMAMLGNGYLTSQVIGLDGGAYPR